MLAFDKERGSQGTASSKGKSSALFGMPIKTFNPDTLLEDMLAAKEGTVFVLGERRIKNHEGRDTLETTFAVIQKATDSQGTTQR